MSIPRDINSPIPSFIRKNMTIIIPPERGTYKVNRQYFIYCINITQINPNLTISIHFELKPFDRERFLMQLCINLIMYQLIIQHMYQSMDG